MPFNFGWCLLKDMDVHFFQPNVRLSRMNQKKDVKSIEIKMIGIDPGMAVSILVVESSAKTMLAKL